jgi:hypothetical protein
MLNAIKNLNQLKSFRKLDLRISVSASLSFEVNPGLFRNTFFLRKSQVKSPKSKVVTLLLNVFSNSPLRPDTGIQKNLDFGCGFRFLNPKSKLNQNIQKTKKPHPKPNHKIKKTKNQIQNQSRILVF